MANVAVRSLDPSAHRELCYALIEAGHTIVYDQVAGRLDDPQKTLDGILERSPDAIVADGALGQKGLLEAYAAREEMPPLVALTRVANLRGELRGFTKHVVEGQKGRSNLGQYITDLLTPK